MIRKYNPGVTLPDRLPCGSKDAQQLDSALGIEGLSVSEGATELVACDPTYLPFRSFRLTLDLMVGEERAISRGFFG